MTRNTMLYNIGKYPTNTITVDIQSVDERIPKLASRYSFIQKKVILIDLKISDKFILFFDDDVSRYSTNSFGPDRGQRGHRNYMHMLWTC